MVLFILRTHAISLFHLQQPSLNRNNYLTMCSLTFFSSIPELILPTISSSHGMLSFSNETCMLYNPTTVHLSSVEGKGTFCGKCGNCRKVCRYWTKECKKRKGDLHGSHTSEGEGGNTGNGDSTKMCDFCGGKGTRNPSATRRIPRKLPNGGKQNMQRQNQHRQVLRLC